MEIARRQGPSAIGVEVHGFDPEQATEEDLALVAKSIYHDKVVVLRDQQLTPSAYVGLARRLGEVVPYYEPVYHHPEHPEIFVSANVDLDGSRVGVPKTGQFWHADYQFMPEPFAFTIFYPRALPTGNRCTYFVDMAEACAELPGVLRSAADAAVGVHSVRNYFKVRPQDLYRPIGDIVREVDERTPPVRAPLVLTHPVTGEPILYLSEGFTIGVEGGAPSLLDALLAASGQRDATFTHPLIRRLDYDLGDIALWDNRSLVHRGLHTVSDEPAVSFRLTVRDGHPFCGAARR